MNSRRNPRRMLVALLVGLLVGGGLLSTTPAGAEVAQAAATNWKKIWTKKLQPHADKRYYTKAASDAKYSTKTETTAAAAAAQSAANAATDNKLGGYYKKTEVDAKLAPLVNSVAATSGGDQTLALTPADQVVRSVSIMPPANGMVIVSSSAQVEGLTAGISRCSISLGTSLDLAAYQIVSPGAGGYHAISGTRGFPVTKGDLLTARLVCNEYSGDALIRDSALTAIFAPS